MPPLQLPCIGELFLHRCSMLLTVLKTNYSDLALGIEYIANRSRWPQLMPSGDEKDAFPHLVRLNHVIQGGLAASHPLGNLDLIAKYNYSLRPQLQDCNVEY